jgi:hypothetical protein
MVAARDQETLAGAVNNKGTMHRWTTKIVRRIVLNCRAGTRSAIKSLRATASACKVLRILLYSLPSSYWKLEVGPSVLDRRRLRCSPSRPRHQFYTSPSSSARTGQSRELGREEWYTAAGSGSRRAGGASPIQYGTEFGWGSVLTGCGLHSRGIDSRWKHNRSPAEGSPTSAFCRPGPHSAATSTPSAPQLGSRNRGCTRTTGGAPDPVPRAVARSCSTGWSHPLVVTHDAS